MKIVSTIMLLFAVVAVNAQIVFEQDLYTNSNKGDIHLEDVIVSQTNNATDIISTGYHIENQGVNDSTCWAILSSIDSSGTGQFHKRYQEVDGSSNPYNTKAYDVEEYNGGYIMVGSVQDSPHHGTSVTGGGDLFILKVNSSGTLVTSKRIDMGGLEEAIAIAPKKANQADFVICGYSDRGSSTREALVLEIDANLNVNWIKRIDLRLASPDPEIVNLYDIVADSNNVWSVGSISTVSAVNTDGLILKLDGNGNYQNAYNFSHQSGTYEKFFGVENDGSDLSISGVHTKFQFPGGFVSHATAHQYNKAGNSMTKNVQLRITQSGGGFKNTAGYDIKPYDVSGTKGYFVVGQATPSSGSKHGFLYELDNNYNAVRQAHYTSSGEVRMNSLDVFQSSNAFTTPAGYRATSTSFLMGHQIKADMNGYTGCNDTLAPSSATINYSVDTLLKDTVIVDSIYTPIIQVDTILDSLVCYDTVTIPTSRSQVVSAVDLVNVDWSAYPNPVRQGGVLNVVTEADFHVNQISLLSVTGSLVQQITVRAQQNKVEIPIDPELPPGLYILRISGLQNAQAFQRVVKLQITQ